jgi:DNA-nicking Smr family endonuclease
MNEDDEDRFWNEYISQVKPLKKNQKHVFINNNNVKTSPPDFLTPPSTNHSVLISIDRITLNKIKKRQILIDASLDLHGYFLDDAFNLLAEFVKNHYFSGHKLLLVITGKSKSANNQLTIKDSIKDWIENSELLNIVHSISDASEIHGGKGAVYLKLRRQA